MEAPLPEELSAAPRPTLSRRALVRTGGLIAGAALTPSLVRAVTRQVDSTSALADPTRVPGVASDSLGTRSAFETPRLSPVGVTGGSSWTPHHLLHGTITPADLHFQRHHNGIPVIDPARHTLTIHGLVERPLEFTLEELRRFPSVTRTYFIECSGNGGRAWNNPKPDMSPQVVEGLTSNSEWTGVAMSTLLRAVGVKSSASWVVAEGSDAAVMARSVPMSKMLDDALVVYAQNGEALRPGNGYPIRLLLPGFEGNMSVKWLRRLEVVDQPLMSREETSKYTDPLPGGKARQFSFVMDVKSLITSPSYPGQLAEKGWHAVRGIAWSGRGRITRVDVSTDGGRSWHEATLPNGALPLAHTRFEHLWQWDGRATRLLSRAFDESGAVQPTADEYRRARGNAPGYHYSAIRAWDVAADGTVTFGGG
ncbi:sulfite dehydrogenase [Gemmatimonas sp.]